MASSSKLSHAEKKKALLEKKPDLAAVPEPQPGLTSDLPKIIEESKAALHAEAEAPLKRGRGRPKGSANKPAEPVAQVQAAQPEIEAPSLAPMISDGIQMFYSQRAEETGFEGYRIKPEKADLLAMQADTVASVYFPQLGEKSSVLVVTLLSWGMHVLGTEMGYRRWKLLKESKEAPKPEVIERQIMSEREGPPLSVAQFFPNQKI